MNKKKDKLLLKIFTGIGILVFPFLFRKPPLKDWLITYFHLGFFATIMDSIFVQQNRLSYPIRYLGKAFKFNILFDYMLFPLVGVFYNQITYRSGIKGILGKLLLITIPFTFAEFVLVRKTRLIQWKRWNWFYTFASMTGINLLGRVFIAVIRKVSDPPIQTPVQQDRKKS